MKTIFTLLGIICFITVYPQDSNVYFSNAINQHLKSYNLKVSKAISQNDFKHAELLFDSLLNSKLKNTKLDHLKFKLLNGKTLLTDSLKKPFLLISSFTWILKKKEEIEAIESLYQLHNIDLEIIILVWGSKKTVKKVSKLYNKKILFVYIDESKNKNNSTISIYKHSFGVPLCFYVSSSKQIVTINKQFYFTSPSKKLKSTKYYNSNFEITQLLNFEKENKINTKLSTINKID